MSNEQNTISGTSGGSSLAPTNGSPFMSYLTGLADIAGKGFAAYSSFAETQAAYKLVEKQTQAKPAQTTPDYLIENRADFLSDPVRVQKTFIYISLGALILAATIWGIKKI